MVERLAAYAELASKSGFPFAMANARTQLFDSLGNQSFLTPGVCASLFGKGDPLSAFFFYVVNLAAVLLIGVNSPYLTVADK